MTGISTGKTLLQVYSYQLPTLTYSTSTITNRSPVNATAAPNPDGWGKTGYVTTAGVRGMTLGATSMLDAIVTGNVWPNYSFIVTLKPEFMGSATGTITPEIRDYEGTIGTTSGAINVSQTRSFQAGIPTTVTITAPTSTDRVGIAFGTVDIIASGYWDMAGNVMGLNAQSWNTLGSAGGAGTYNEVKFEHVSGSTNWDVVPCTGNMDGFTYLSPLVKGTYYNMDKVGALLSPLLMGDSTSVIRMTFRNKADNTKTLVTDYTVTCHRV